MDPETIKKLITLVFIAIVSLLFLIFVASYTQSGPLRLQRSDIGFSLARLNFLKIRSGLHILEEDVSGLFTLLACLFFIRRPPEADYG